MIFNNFVSKTNNTNHHLSHKKQKLNNYKANLKKLNLHLKTNSYLNHNTVKNHNKNPYQIVHKFRYKNYYKKYPIYNPCTISYIIID